MNTLGFSQSSKLGLALLSLTIFLGGKLKAFPYDETVPSILGLINEEGVRDPQNGTELVYRIPYKNWPDNYSFDIRGADGGDAKGRSSDGNANARGGGGAFAEMTVRIDPTAENSLRPGGEIKVILGARGESKNRENAAAGGGGGGSAVLYRAPVKDEVWKVLAIVGGGGGGAAASWITFGEDDQYEHDGKHANVETFGDDGRSHSNSGGQDGGPGVGKGGDNYFGGGGGGVDHEREREEYGGAGNIAAGTGSSGGLARGGDGGFGFGAGGAGDVRGGSSTRANGGGGGGYSGGGAGESGGGGGGGSFINPVYAIASAIEIPGYESLNGVFSSFGVSLVSQEIPVSSMVLDEESGSVLDYLSIFYQLPEATIVDFYGNEIGVTPPTIIDVLSPGNHEFTYTETDQFGRSVSGTFSLEVIETFKPTFQVNNITVPEDSGAFLASVIYNENANDEGESITSYEVITSDESLFASSPAFDEDWNLTFTPAADAHGVATVTVYAIDNPDNYLNGRSDPVNFTITISPVDDPPTFTVQSPVQISENSLGGIMFSAVEKFGQPMSYQLTGADAALFAFNAGNLTLSLLSPKDYENPGDSNTDNLFEVTLTATGSDGVTTLSLSIPLLNADESPNAPLLNNTAVQENTVAVGVVTGSDPEGDPVTLRLSGGNDAALFSFDSITGALAFYVAPDFENPGDANQDNGYEIRFTAADPAMNSTSVNVVVTVIDENQTPGAPALSLSRIAEGNTMVGSLSALAEEGEQPTFVVVSGPDSGLFMISEGTLNFKTPPSFDSPGDADADNVYFVEVAAVSGGLQSAASLFAVTVVSVDNVAPISPVISSSLIDENSSVVGTLSSSDSDGDPISYSIQGGADSALFEILNGDTLAFVASPDFENPTDQNGDNVYEVSLVATDGLKTSEEGMLQIAVSDLIDKPADDILIDGQSLVSLPLEENLEAGMLVGVLSVVDVESGDSHLLDLTTDSSGRFAIVNGNELIATGAPMIDYESDNFHVIRIRATDSGGNAYTKRIEIPVINLEEGSVLQRDGFTLQTNTNSRWLDFGAAFNKKVTVMEGRVERGDVDETDFNWQFATWDEVMEFYKEASLDWHYDTSEGRWAFLFPDTYFNQDGLSSGAFWDSFALNRDGSYGGNKYLWDRDNPRILYVFAQGDFVSSLSDKLFRGLGIRYVVAGSQYESLLQMDGELYTANRADVFMLIDRTSGVGFSEWAGGQERSSDFTADDNDDGQAVGLDYVFGEQKPMKMLSSNEILAPASTWKDVEISLSCSNDMRTWTTLLTYRGGSIVQTAEELQQHGITIENGVITHGNGGVADQTFYRYRVDQFDDSAAQ